MKIGGKEFPAQGHTYVMGILNVTPDSFSDGGRFQNLDLALAHAEQMAREGADVIDVGGESIRPGYESVTAEEEISRVVPVIEALKKRFDLPVSLDTCKAEVAKAGAEAGADMINDIWGLKRDGEMADLIARNGLSCCLMHNRSSGEYGDLMKDVAADLRESLKIAKQAGIPSDRILLDPGVGFAKSYRENLKVMARAQDLKELGYPLLLGCSRKSVIGLTLDRPVEERLEGTLAATVIAVTQGYLFVRVHDVKENVLAIRMAEAILKEG